MDNIEKGLIMSLIDDIFIQPVPSVENFLQSNSFEELGSKYLMSEDFQEKSFDEIKEIIIKNMILAKKYCINILEKVLEKKDVFIATHSEGDDFSFGSNVNGSILEDGKVYYNSHNEEEFEFNNIEEFAQYWFEEKKIAHKRRYYVGDRDSNGDVVLLEGADAGNIDYDDDSNTVWSKYENITAHPDCIYCENNNSPEHYNCDFCGDGMCEDCFSSDSKHTKHSNVYEGDIDIKKVSLLTKANNGDIIKHVCCSCYDKNTQEFLPVTNVNIATCKLSNFEENEKILIVQYADLVSPDIIESKFVLYLSSLKTLKQEIETLSLDSNKLIKYINKALNSKAKQFIFN